MAKASATTGELLSMPLADLRKDVLGQRMSVRRMRLGIEMKKEKDTARYRREKRQLARMLTALKTLEEGSRPAPFSGGTERQGAASGVSSERMEKGAGLKKKPKSRTVPRRRSSPSSATPPAA